MSRQLNSLDLVCNVSIRNTVGVHGVFEESLVWSMILQSILCTSIEEAYENRLAAL